MSATEQLRNLSAMAHKHREDIRKRVDTLQKAAELIAEYKAATGEDIAHLEDAISWKAKRFAIKEFNAE